MEPKLIAIAIWGFASGLALIPVYTCVHRAVVTSYNPAGTIARTLLVMLVATLLACFALGALMLGAGFLFGLLPLRGEVPYFAWSFVAGGLLIRALIEVR